MPPAFPVDLNGVRLLLTEAACKNAKPKEKPYRLADARGSTWR
jgi:hypothetical protein